MRIQGLVTIEGIKFRVDIETSDDEEEFYVTNVHPNCLVIPKERWQVEFLGLSQETVAELHQRRVFTLGQLVNETWTIGVNDLSPEAHGRVEQALNRFREIALVFERAGTSYPNRVEKAPLDQSVAVQSANGNGSKDIVIIGLPSEQQEALRRKGIQTLAELVTAGRNRLLMTSKMDEKGLRKIEETLRREGLTLPE